MRKGFAAILAVTVTVGVGAMAPAAGAITFGANLNEAVDQPYTCGTAYFANSCNIFGSTAGGPSFYAPASGTVNSVSVRTGPGPQGPMQVVVLRSLYQHNPNFGVDPNAKEYFACCFVEQYGPIFTPAANTVTTVPTNLTMVVDPTPPTGDFTTNARGDFLSLSVLDGNTIIPARQDQNSILARVAPAPTPQTTPAPSPNPVTYGSSGSFHPLLAANLEPGGGGGGGGGAGNAITLPTGGNLTGSTASIPLTCALTTACDGLLRLTNQTAGVANAAAKVKTFGKKKFTIPAGKTKRIKVKLNKAGKSKARGRKKVTFTATATIGSQTVSKRVKLKRK